MHSLRRPILMDASNLAFDYSPNMVFSYNVGRGLSKSHLQGGPAEMRRICMRINQSIFEIYLYLIP